MRSRIIIITKKNTIQTSARSLEVKKLASILATFMSMTGVKNEALILECISYIHYLIQLKKKVNETQVQVLIDSKSEVNATYLTLFKKLNFPIRPTDIKA